MSEPKNIWVASSDGELERVSSFIEQEGVSVNAQDEFGYSPLHAAASYDHHQLAKYLINKGADVNLRDNDGDTPLHYCETTDMGQLLLDSGADPMLLNDENQLPIQVAMEDENEKLVELLRTRLPAGVDFEQLIGLSSNDPAGMQVDLAHCLADEGEDDNERKRMKRRRILAAIVWSWQIMALLAASSLNTTPNQLITVPLTDTAVESKPAGGQEEKDQQLRIRLIDGQEQLCDQQQRCYPRQFQPTDQFQSILPGQQLPPGLHVQVNLATGKKEAKRIITSADTSGIAAEEKEGNEQMMVQAHDAEPSLSAEQETPSEATSQAVVDAQPSGYKETERFADSSDQQNQQSGQRRRIPAAQMYEIQLLIQRLACHVYAAAPIVITTAPPDTDSNTDLSVHNLTQLTQALDDLEALSHHIDIGAWLTRPLPPLECPQSEINVILTLKSTLHLLVSYYMDPRLMPNSTLRILAARSVGAAIHNNPTVRQWSIQSGTCPSLFQSADSGGSGSGRRASESLMERLLGLLCLADDATFYYHSSADNMETAANSQFSLEQDSAVQSSVLFALLSIIRHNSEAVRHHLPVASLSKCLLPRTVYQTQQLQLLKRGLQLIVDLLAIPEGRLMVLQNNGELVNSLTSWTSQHFRLFCLQPQGMLLDICPVACEALISLVGAQSDDDNDGGASDKDRLVQTNEALRLALDLANERWFSTPDISDNYLQSTVAAMNCRRPIVVDSLKEQCGADEFLQSLHEIIPEVIVELSLLATRID